MGSYKRVVLTEKANNATTALASSDIQKQVSKFDTTYTSKKLNDLYSEFDSITYNNELNNTAVLSTNVNTFAKVNTNFKTMVYLTTAVLVTLLLAFLAIYNIFVINGMSSNIKMLQEDVAVAEAQFDQVYSEVNSLTEEELKTLIAQQLSGNFGDISLNGVVNIELLQTTNASKQATSTNWFDQFCNFFSNLFGG